MMADREIAGRCMCPICGAPAQDVRVNVNQKLYCYCDNGCSFKFNSAQSRKFLPKLRAGENVVTEQNLLIKSINNKQEVKQNDEVKNITSGRVTGSVGATGAIGGVNAERRPEPAAGGAGGGGNSEPRRGIFAGWFSDDDDE